MHRYGHLFSTLKTFRNTQGHLWTLLRLSHGENRGSSPLGSATLHLFNLIFLLFCLSSQTGRFGLGKSVRLVSFQFCDSVCREPRLIGVTRLGRASDVRVPT